jgi:O-antigen ligase
VRKLVFLLSFWPLFLVFSDVFRVSESREKILSAWVTGAFLAALVALAQFFAQWWVGVEKIFAFWTQEVLPVFLGAVFSEMVTSYPSLLVNISGTTVLRASGFFPDPHIASLFWGMSLPIAFFLVWKNVGMRQKYFGVCTGIIFLADIFTFSRGGYLGLILGAGVFFWLFFSRGAIWKKQIIKIIAIGFALIAVLISPVGTRLISSFSSEDKSNIERVRLWEEALDLITLRPVGGAGLGNYPLIVKPSADYREPFYAHNLFLDIALETGLVGLFFFVAFLFSGILSAWKKWRQGSDVLALALLSSLLVFFTHSFFESPLFSVHILPIFLLLMAASIFNYLCFPSNL